MKYTRIAANAFEQLQLNAGILLTSFDPATGAVVEGNIFAATSGGSQFATGPEFTDFGEDIDNVPANTKQLKRLTNYDIHLTGTAKTINPTVAEFLIAAADTTVSSGVSKVTPRSDLGDMDFQDIWWVGDYSDKNGTTNGGFLAICMKDVLNVGGLQIKSNDDGKGEFAFDFQAHYDIEDISAVPFEIYIKQGEDEPGMDATLKTLAIGSIDLTPAFDPKVLSYAAETSNSTNTITATPNDDAATVEIKNGTTTVASGSTATWADGKNIVTVTVTNTYATKVYRIEVTKS